MASEYSISKKTLYWHPPYSPELAPSDFYFYADPKKFLARKTFESNEDMFAYIVVKDGMEMLREALKLLYRS